MNRISENTTKSILMNGHTNESNDCIGHAFSTTLRVKRGKYCLESECDEHAFRAEAVVSVKYFVPGKTGAVGNEPAVEVIKSLRLPILSHRQAALTAMITFSVDRRALTRSWVKGSVTRYTTISAIG